MGQIELLQNDKLNSFFYKFDELFDYERYQLNNQLNNRLDKYTFYFL